LAAVALKKIDEYFLYKDFAEPRCFVPKGSFPRRIGREALRAIIVAIDRAFVQAATCQTAQNPRFRDDSATVFRTLVFMAARFADGREGVVNKKAAFWRALVQMGGRDGEHRLALFLAPLVVGQPRHP